MCFSHIRKLDCKAVILVTEMLRAAILEYGCFGVTTFITILIHLLELTPTVFKLKSLVIELCEMTCDKMTGIKTRQAIVDFFTLFGMTENDLLHHACFVTDRGANMLLALEDFRSHTCLAYLCNKCSRCYARCTWGQKNCGRRFKSRKIPTLNKKKYRKKFTTNWASTQHFSMSILWKFC